jgi:hypothetical protein
MNVIITAPVGGPILSNGGAIIVTSGGSVAGRPDSVDAVSFSIAPQANSGAGASGGH